MKLAVMQPYFFPYIGYFQLINAVDKFVFYDDVNFIKGGWINRNRILLNGKDQYITLQCIKASPHKLIKEVEVDVKSKEYANLLKTIEMAYKKAKYFNKVFPIIENVFHINIATVSFLAERSILAIAKYLNIKTQFLKSSEAFSETKGLEKTERLIAICKKTETDNYINSAGGMELYSTDIFAANKIHLSFIKSRTIQYNQFKKEFIPWLSIIDVVMFNSPEEINKMLNQYELI